MFERKPVWRCRWGLGPPGVQLNCNRWENEVRHPARLGASRTGHCYPDKGRSPAPPPEAGSHTCVRQKKCTIFIRKLDFETHWTEHDFGKRRKNFCWIFHRHLLGRHDMKDTHTHTRLLSWASGRQWEWSHLSSTTRSVAVSALHLRIFSRFWIFSSRSDGSHLPFRMDAVRPRIRGQPGLSSHF